MLFNIFHNMVCAYLVPDQDLTTITVYVIIPAKIETVATLFILTLLFALLYDLPSNYFA